MNRFYMPALSSAVALLLTTVAQAAAPIDSYAGAWRLQFNPDAAAVADGAQEFKDAVLFHNNQISAEAFSMYGFPTTPYTITETQNIATATMASQTQGTLEWAVRRNGGQLMGLLVWTKPDGDVHRYSFTGVVYAEDDGLEETD